MSGEQFNNEMDNRWQVSFSPYFFFWLIFPATLLHAWWAFVTKSGGPLSACGGLIVIFGVLTGLRPFLRLGFDTYYRKAGTIDGGYFSKEEEPDEYKKAAQEEKKDFTAIYRTGTALVLVGTALNAYGGYLGDLIFK